MTNDSLFQNSNSVHPSTETDIQLSETATQNPYDTDSQSLDKIIHAYSRAQAIKDGTLVDVSSRARQAGFKYPMAITQSAYDMYVVWNEEDSERQGPHHEMRRLAEMLCNLRLLINRMPSEGRLFTFLCIPRSPYSTLKTPVSVQLKAVIGLGDNLEPVITIMMPDED